MNARIPLLLAAVPLAAAGIYLAAGREAALLPAAAPAAMVAVALPERLIPAASMGKTAFEASCATCHGENAAGRAGKGPPLIHRYYEPSHHGNAAFLMAAREGVTAHHWNFGDMPPVKGLTNADIANIVAYVRSVQRANGIQ